MIIHRAGRWLVVTPPKTGSNTMMRILTGPGFGGVVVRGEDDHHDTAIPRHAAGCRVYLSVRDPFARASSLYRWEHMGLPHASRLMSFVDFCGRVLLDHDGHYKHWRTIDDWYPGPAIPIHVEAVEDVRENVQGEPWRAAYDREPGAWPLVARWAARDCRRFGYGGAG